MITRVRRNHQAARQPGSQAARQPGSQAARKLVRAKTAQRNIEIHCPPKGDPKRGIREKATFE